MAANELKHLYTEGGEEEEFNPTIDLEDFFRNEEEYTVLYSCPTDGQRGPSLTLPPHHVFTHLPEADRNLAKLLLNKYPAIYRSAMVRVGTHPPYSVYDNSSPDKLREKFTLLKKSAQGFKDTEKELLRRVKETDVTGRSFRNVRDLIDTTSANFNYEKRFVTVHTFTVDILNRINHMRNIMVERNIECEHAE